MTSDDLATVADQLDRVLLWLRRRVPARMSTTAVSTLDTLLADGPLRVSDLAEREALSQPGMTTLVNRLEASGHAERLPDPTDGRAALVRITEEGKRLLRDRHAARTAVLRSTLDQLDPADQAALAAVSPVLDRLLQRAGTPTQPTIGAAAS